MSHGKQFTLYTHNRGPNGWYVVSLRPHSILTPDLFIRKVAIVLEELGLTYESVYLDFNKGEQKAPEFLKINPNGRIPALVDHQNNDFTVWWVLAVVIVPGLWLIEIQGDPRDTGVLGRQVRQGPQAFQHWPRQIR